VTALYRTWVGAVLVFLLLPILIVVISSFSSSGYLRFPPSALSWRWYVAFIADRAWLAAIGVSAVLALFAAAVVTTFAFLAALARTRLRVPGAAWLDLLMLSPLLMPHSAIALALWTVLTDLGWLGSYQGLLLAHAILCFPFAYRPLVNAMRQFDLSMEEAALNLGATPALAFLKVTLPLLRSGISAAFLFSFIVSFDEVSVTLFLIGPNVTTLPVRVFTEIQESGSPVVAAISSFLVGIAILFFLVTDRLVGARLFIAGDALSSSRASE
jgi:putative spermidine/putrescine transport system permease protein